MQDEEKTEQQSPCTVCTVVGEQLSTATISLAERDEELATTRATLAERDEEIEILNEELNEKNAQIEKLNKIIGTAKSAAAVTKTTAAKVVTPMEELEFEGENYKWQRSTFSLPGGPRVYTAAEASLDDKLIRKLLSIRGQKVLVIQA